MLQLPVAGSPSPGKFTDCSSWVVRPRHTHQWPLQPISSSWRQSVTCLRSLPSTGPDGGELIGESLIENKVLKRLFIDGSDIGDDGAAEVAHALRSNTVLEELSLKSNSLSDQAARSFADVLEEIDSTGIKKLRLG